MWDCKKAYTHLKDTNYQAEKLYFDTLISAAKLSKLDLLPPIL